MLAGLLLLYWLEVILKVAGCMGAARLHDRESESERNVAAGARHRAQV